MTEEGFRRMLERDQEASERARQARSVGQAIDTESAMPGVSWRSGGSEHVMDAEGMVQRMQDFQRQVLARAWEQVGLPSSSDRAAQHIEAAQRVYHLRVPYRYEGTVTGRESSETRQLLDGDDALDLMLTAARQITAYDAVMAATAEERHARDVASADAQIKSLLELYPELREKYPCRETAPVRENTRRIVL